MSNRFDVRTMVLGVLAEVKDNQKDTDVDSLYMQKIKPLVFSEQIMAKLFTFLREECSGVQEVEPIRVDFGMIERDNSIMTLAVNHTLKFSMR